MTEVISVKFRNRGKSYFFAPNGKTVRAGEKVIVETSKGLEMAECSCANHMVDDSCVIQPLRPLVRIATRDDMRIADINAKREKEAFVICRREIETHGLDMKLVDVECSFDGNKTTFFFTSENRVDFRELVKDLAAIFRNRIELRQIGVRDEAKMLGGLGICGRPFCCSRFLDDFQPVSTKMAKVQSMSLNPSKISGSCGRLMCCLRYEQEAYEELVMTVPKLGTFVETPAGYGVVTQVNLLRRIIKVKLDGEGDDTVKNYKADEVAVVPGGRPKDGEVPPSVLKRAAVQEKEPEENEDEWDIPDMLVSDVPDAETENGQKKNTNRKKRRGGKKNKHSTAEKPEHETKPTEEKQVVKPKPKQGNKPRQQTNKPAQKTQEVKPQKVTQQTEAKQTPAPQPATENKNTAEKKNSKRRYYHHNKPKQKQSGGK